MNLDNLANYIHTITEHSTMCNGVCSVVQEVRLNVINAVKKIHMESSTKVKGSGSKKTRYAVNIGPVLGHMATGGGHSKLSETAAALQCAWNVHSLVLKPKLAKHGRLNCRLKPGHL